MLFACVLMLNGKYLLFYLLERRLLDGTLHRLLLDGLDHLMIQMGLLEKTQILKWVSWTLRTSTTVINKTIQDSPVVWEVHTWAPAGPGLTWKVWVYEERSPWLNDECLEFRTWEKEIETDVCKAWLNTNLHNKTDYKKIINDEKGRATHISFSFWGLTVWSIRGLESTGELIGKLSLSECSGLIDWLRNCETKGRKLISQSSRQIEF